MTFVEHVDLGKEHALLNRIAGALAVGGNGAAGGTGDGAGDGAGRGAGRGAGDEVDPGREAVLALEALHQLRDQLVAWEPTLIEQARAHGISWAALAPVLGVTTRQAAERRYLRLLPARDETLTGEQRVQATRDRRAGDRAVAAWARANASELRQIAGQASAVEGLTTSGRRTARDLATSLTEDDPATLLQQLADMHPHLLEADSALAERVDAVGRKVSRVRRETQRRRMAPTT